ncbi:phosphopantetheine-binding protein, partial [Paenibacillus sp. BJ-4]|uniref:phosphopantetheine-binding protein n=1 Tax=Paenibacillus sp. BJ-4 TaxID=2878097 RepID=UPI001CF02C6E
QVLKRYPNAVVIELGPGQTLTTLMRQSACWGAEHRGMRTLPTYKTGGGERGQWLRSVAELWSGGVSIGWGALHESRVRNRVELPTYPFERQRYWIEPRLSQNAPTLARGRDLERLEPEQWLYEPVLRQTALSLWHPEECHCLWMVFEDKHDGWIDLLAERLESTGQSIVRVRAASNFEKIDDQLYSLNPTNPEHYEKIFDSLASDEPLIRIICSWSESDSDFGGLAGFFQLSRAVQVYTCKIPVHICIVTEGLYSIAGETEVQPKRMILSGIGNVWMQEHEKGAFHLVDAMMPNHRHQASLMADSMLEDFVSASAGAPRIYRNNRRWTVEYVPLTEMVEEKGIVQTSSATYLLIGPFDSKMQTFAQYLVQQPTNQGHVRIIVMNDTFDNADSINSPLIEADHMNVADNTQHIASQALKLEEQGAEVHFIPVKFQVQGALTEAIAQAAILYGNIIGVVYTDWSSEEINFVAGSDLNYATVESELGRTVKGLNELERALVQHHPKYCFIQSSIASKLGGLGLSIHAAAAAYTEAFVRRHNEQTDSVWHYIGWDAWSSDTAPELEKRGGELGRMAIRPQEGTHVWSQLMTSGNVHHYLVSTSDFTTRHNYAFQNWKAEQADLDREQPLLQPRPVLPVPIVEPRHELEQQLADAWINLLGVAPIGVHDDFFSLGGHSLLATQVISWVNSRFPIEFPLKYFFEHPTVAEIAEAIELMLIEKLETMTEEQASQLL